LSSIGESFDLNWDCKVKPADCTLYGRIGGCFRGGGEALLSELWLSRDVKRVGRGSRDSPASFLRISLRSLQASSLVQSLVILCAGRVTALGRALVGACAGAQIHRLRDV
jgi:hypothetical protein